MSYFAVISFSISLQLYFQHFAQIQPTVGRSYSTDIHVTPLVYGHAKTYSIMSIPKVNIFPNTGVISTVQETCSILV